jgi:hypothetical protein
VVAKAYLDQLSRSAALPAERIEALRKAIASAESSHMNKKKVAALQGMAPALEKDAAAAKAAEDAARLRALAEVLKHPSA